MKNKFFVIVFAFAFIAAACNTPIRQADPIDKTPTPLPQPTPIPLPTPNPNPNPTTPPTRAPFPVPVPVAPPIPTSSGAEKNFSVTADDSAATPDMVMVDKGDIVNLKITLKTTNVYPYGLEFRGGNINSGTIQPGATKTITFTADSTVVLQAHWPSSGVVKPAHIEVMVH